MLNRILITFLVLLLPFGLTESAYGQNKNVPNNQGQVQLSFAPLVKKVAPAVVNIYTKRNILGGFKNPFMDDPFFGRFFNQDMFGGQMRRYLESALGSGVIVTEDGLVVTNAHVIQGASEISVVLADGTEYVADIVLSDDASDLALLRVSDPNATLPYVTLKPSESLEVGDLVLAIGNPFGVGQTVTSGIVSAQGRSSLDINDYNFFIQTDAAINPGNSGGPLVAMDGRVVGINTAIYSRGGGSIGIGFAIPSEMVASVIAAEVNGQVGDKGIIRPWLGVSAQDVTSDLASNLGLPKPSGALLTQVHSASPFAQAGIKESDVVVQVNNHMIRDSAELKFRIATVPIGQKASVVVIRRSKKITFEVAAIAPPEDPPRETRTLSGNHALRGAVIANLNPAVSEELGLTGGQQGVVVMQSPPSFFVRSLLPGDVLVEINDQVIKTTDDVQDALQGITRKNGARIIIKRRGRNIQFFIR